MRDKLGRFVKGHNPLSSKDLITGRFIKNSMETIEEKVDRILLDRRVE